MTEPQAPKHTALLPVRVKPLAWYTPTDHPHDNEDAKLMAHGIGGRYSISEQTSLHIGGMGHLLWWADDQFTFAEFRTVEEAQAAAQADHAARIRSAIEPDPSSSAQEVRAALEPFAKAADAYDPVEADSDWQAWGHRFLIGDLRRARKALASTSPVRSQDDKSGPVEARFLIRKGGVYYRPNSQGYTTSVSEAGRYTLAEAQDITHPNGPDGPRDGMSYIEAPAPPVRSQEDGE